MLVSRLKEGTLEKQDRLSKGKLYSSVSIKKVRDSTPLGEGVSVD